MLKPLAIAILAVTPGFAAVTQQDIQACGTDQNCINQRTYLYNRDCYIQVTQQRQQMIYTLFAILAAGAGVFI